MGFWHLILGFHGGSAAATITAEGLEYTIPGGPLGYTITGVLIHYTIPGGPIGYTLPGED